MSIYFLRSCATEWHEQDKLCGHADIPLSNAGRENARLLSNQLANIDFDLIICSPLDRAHETATIALGNRGIPITFDPRIIERDCGDLEGKHTPSGFWDAENDMEYSCAESLSEFIARVHDFLRKTQKKCGEKNILIVSHGGVSIAVNSYFNNLPQAFNPGEFSTL